MRICLENFHDYSRVSCSTEIAIVSRLPMWEWIHIVVWRSNNRWDWLIHNNDRVHENQIQKKVAHNTRCKNIYAVTRERWTMICLLGSFPSIVFELLIHEQQVFCIRFPCEVWLTSLLFSLVMIRTARCIHKVVHPSLFFRSETGKNRLLCIV